jgi:hypothetical protein
MVRLTRSRSSTSLSMEIISSSYLKKKAGVTAANLFSRAIMRAQRRSQGGIHAAELFEYEPFSHVFERRPLAQLLHDSAALVARPFVDARAGGKDVSATIVTRG